MTETKVKSTHTPGPWQVLGSEVFSNLANEVGEGYGEETALAAIYSWPDVPGMKEANARLIAAAPELLEVLKAMHKHFITEAEHIGETEETLERLSMAAISKAEGGN